MQLHLWPCNRNKRINCHKWLQKSTENINSTAVDFVRGKKVILIEGTSISLLSVVSPRKRGILPNIAIIIERRVLQK